MLAEHLAPLFEGGRNALPPPFPAATIMSAVCVAIIPVSLEAMIPAMLVPRSPVIMPVFASIPLIAAVSLPATPMIAVAPVERRGIMQSAPLPLLEGATGFRAARIEAVDRTVGTPVGLPSVPAAMAKIARHHDGAGIRPGHRLRRPDRLVADARRSEDEKPGSEDEASDSLLQQHGVPPRVSARSPGATSRKDCPVGNERKAAAGHNRCRRLMQVIEQGCSGTVGSRQRIPICRAQTFQEAAACRHTPRAWRAPEASSRRPSCSRAKAARTGTGYGPPLSRPRRAPESRPAPS